MKNYVCLVSDGKTISVSNSLPPDVSVSGGQWAFRSFNLRVGQAISVYTDSTWVGPICVYDSDSPDLAAQVTKDTFEHTLALVSRRIQSHAPAIFGGEVVQEMWNHRYATPQHPAAEYSPLGKIYAKLTDLISGICFRGT